MAASRRHAVTLTAIKSQSYGGSSMTPAQVELHRLSEKVILQQVRP
jgi:hypothetical protein